MRMRTILSIILSLIATLSQGLSLYTTWVNETELLQVAGSSSSQLTLCLDSSVSSVPIRSLFSPGATVPAQDVSYSSLYQLCIFGTRDFFQLAQADSLLTVIGSGSALAPLVYLKLTIYGTQILTKRYVIAAGERTETPHLVVTPSLVFPALALAQGIRARFDLTPVPPLSRFDCFLLLQVPSAPDGSVTTVQRVVAKDQAGACSFPAADVRLLISVGLRYPAREVLIEVKAGNITAGWGEVQLRDDISCKQDGGKVVINSMEDAGLVFRAQGLFPSEGLTCRCASLIRTAATYSSRSVTVSLNSATASFPLGTFQANSTLRCDLSLSGVAVCTIPEVLTYSQLVSVGQPSPTYSIVGTTAQTVTLRLRADLDLMVVQATPLLLLCMVDNVTSAATDIKRIGSEEYKLTCSLPTFQTVKNISLGVVLNGKRKYQLIAAYPVLPTFVLVGYTKSVLGSVFTVTLESIPAGQTLSLFCAFSTAGSQTRRQKATWTSNRELSCEATNQYTAGTFRLWLEDPTGRNLTVNSLVVTSESQWEVLNLIPRAVLPGAAIQVFASGSGSESEVRLCFYPTRNVNSPVQISQPCEPTGNTSYTCHAPSAVDTYVLTMTKSQCDSIRQIGLTTTLWVSEKSRLSSPTAQMLVNSPEISVVWENLNVDPALLVCAMNSPRGFLTGNLVQRRCVFSAEQVRTLGATRGSVYITAKDFPSARLSSTVELELVYPAVISLPRPFAAAGSSIAVSYSMSSSLSQEVSCEFRATDTVTGKRVAVYRAARPMAGHMECSVPDLAFSGVFRSVDLRLVYSSSAAVVSNAIPLVLLGSLSALGHTSFKVRAVASSAGFAVRLPDPTLCDLVEYLTCDYVQGVSKISLTPSCRTRSEALCPIPETTIGTYRFSLSINVPERYELVRVENLVIFSASSLCLLWPGSFTVLVDSTTSISANNVVLALLWGVDMVSALSAAVALRVPGLGMFPVASISTTGYEFALGKTNRTANYRYTVVLDPAAEVDCGGYLAVQPVSLSISDIAPAILLTGARARVKVALTTALPQAVAEGGLQLCCEGAVCVTAEATDDSNISFEAIVSAISSEGYMPCKLSSKRYPAVTSLPAFMVRTVPPPSIASVSPRAVYTKLPGTFVMTLTRSLPGVAHVYCTSGALKTEARVISPTQLNCTIPPVFSNEKFFVGVQYDDMPAQYFGQPIYPVEAVDIVSANTSTVHRDGQPTHILIMISGEFSSGLLCVFDESILVSAVQGPNTNTAICVHKYLTNSSSVSLAAGANLNQFSEPITLTANASAVLYSVSPAEVYSIKKQTLTFLGESLNSTSWTARVSRLGGAYVTDLELTQTDSSSPQLNLGELPAGDYETRLRSADQQTSASRFTVKKLPAAVAMSPEAELSSNPSPTLQLEFDGPLIQNASHACYLVEGAVTVVVEGRVNGNVLTCVLGTVVSGIDWQNISAKKYSVGVLFGKGSPVFWTSWEFTVRKTPEISEVSPQSVSSVGNSVVRLTNTTPAFDAKFYIKLESSSSHTLIVAANVTASGLEFMTPNFSTVSSGSSELYSVSISANGKFFAPVKLSLAVYPPLQVFALWPSAVYAGRATTAYVVGKDLPTFSGICRLTETAENQMASTWTVPIIPVNSTRCGCPVMSSLRYDHSIRIEVSRNGVDFTQYSRSIKVFGKTPRLTDSPAPANQFWALTSAIRIVGENLNENLVCLFECAGIRTGVTVAAGTGVCYRPVLSQHRACIISVLDSAAGETLSKLMYPLMDLPVIYTAGSLLGFSGQLSNFTLTLWDTFDYPLSVSAQLGGILVSCEKVNTIRYNCTVPSSLPAGTYAISLSYNLSSTLVATPYSYKLIPEPTISRTAPSAIMCGADATTVWVHGKNMTHDVVGCSINDVLRSSSIAYVNSSCVACIFAAVPQSLCWNDTVYPRAQGWLVLHTAAGAHTARKYLTVLLPHKVLGAHPTARYVQGKNFISTLFFPNGTLLVGAKYECVAGGRSYPVTMMSPAALQCNISDPLYLYELELSLSVQGYTFPVWKLYGASPDLQLVSAWPQSTHPAQNLTIFAVWDSNLTVSSELVCLADSATELPAAYLNSTAITVEIGSNMSPGSHTVACSQDLNSFSNSLAFVVVSSPILTSIVPNVLLAGTDTSFLLIGSGFVFSRTQIKLAGTLWTDCTLLNTSAANCAAPMVPGEYSVAVSANSGAQWLISSLALIVAPVPTLVEMRPTRLALGIENVVRLSFQGDLSVFGASVRFWLCDQEAENVRVLYSSGTNTTAVIRQSFPKANSSYCTVSMSLNNGVTRIALQPQLTLLVTAPALSQNLSIVPAGFGQSLVLNISGKGLDLLYRPECRFSGSKNVSATLVGTEELICMVPASLSSNTSPQSIYVQSSNLPSALGPVALLRLPPPTLTRANTTLLYPGDATYVRVSGSNLLFRSGGVPMYSCQAVLSNGTALLAESIDDESASCATILATYCVRDHIVCLIPGANEVENMTLGVYLEGFGMRSGQLTLAYFYPPTILSASPLALVRDHRRLLVTLESSVVEGANLRCVLTGANLAATYKVLAENTSATGVIKCDFSPYAMTAGKYALSLETNNRSGENYTTAIDVAQGELEVISAFPSTWSTYMSALNLTLTGRNLKSAYYYYADLYNSSAFLGRFNVTYQTSSTLTCELIFDPATKSSSQDLVLTVYANAGRITPSNLALPRVADLAAVSTQIAVVDPATGNASLELSFNGTRMDAIATCKFGALLSTATVDSDKAIRCVVPLVDYDEGALLEMQSYVELLDEYGTVLQNVSFAYLQRPAITSLYISIDQQLYVSHLRITPS